MSDDLIVNFEDIEDAVQQIAPVAVHTQLIDNPVLNALTGGRVFIKPECLQRTGSFKIRGAYNRISRFTEEEKVKGVVAFSSGYHAQGVACAAMIMGVEATIVMPIDSPAIKMENTKAYGAKVVTYDRFTESREEIADKISQDTGAIVVPSFDDKYIIAGQGTTGYEIANDIKAMGLSLDIAVFNCGGAGLTSGSTMAIKTITPNAVVHTVEPEDFDDTARSLKSGKIEKIDPKARSICDALLSPSPGALTLPILQKYGVILHGVSDDEVRDAVRFAARELKLVVEPGGAAGLAAVLTGKIDVKGKVAVITCSGGNIEPQQLSEILSS